MPRKSKEPPKGLMMHVNTNVAALGANGSTTTLSSQMSDRIDLPLASPTKKGYQASVATSAPPRPIRRTYRGDRSAASSAASLRQPGTYHQSSSRRNPSVNSLGFSAFPGVPGGMQNGGSTDSFNDRFRAIGRKMSFTKASNDPSQIDLSLTSEENERNTGLGIHAAAMSHATSRRPSMSRSIMSNGSTTARTHLAENVGFSFKTTTNFVHPSRQTPRTFSTHSSRSRTHSYATGMYSDECEEDYADRMNSFTGSDGGWKSGWNMREGCSRENSVSKDMPAMDFPVPDAMATQRRSRNSGVLEEDLGPDDLPPVKEDLSPGASPPAAATILEEDLDPMSAPPVKKAARNDDTDLRHVAPSMAIAVALANEQKRASSLMSSDSSADLSPGAGPRSRTSTNQSAESRKHMSGTSSPFEKALNFLINSKDSEPEDAASRAASIRAARAAFEDREAAKSKKVADRQAKRDAWLRRKSETVDWIARRRKPSIAVDSAIESEQRTPASDASLESSDAEEGSPHRISGAKFVPFNVSDAIQEAPMATPVEETPVTPPIEQPEVYAVQTRKSLARASLPKLDVASVQEAAIERMTMRNSRARSSLANLAMLDLSSLDDSKTLRGSFARMPIEAELEQAKNDAKENATVSRPEITYDTIQEDVSPGAETKSPLEAEVGNKDNTLYPPITFTPIADGVSPSSEANPHTPGGDGGLWPPISYETYPLAETPGLETPGTAGESMLWPPIDYNSLSNTSSPRSGFANSPHTGFANSPRMGHSAGHDSDKGSFRGDNQSQQMQAAPAAKAKGRFLSKLGFGNKSRMLKV